MLRLIHSKAVPFFRTQARGPLLDVPFVVGVITAPAPNTGAYLRVEPDGLARVGGTPNLVLGAWGCGAFGTPPAIAINAFRRWLFDPRFEGRFERVVFAVYGKDRPGRANQAAFQEAFGGL